jgi:NADP-dependent 3-hydroxy acid dehydrogenase YdfG
MRQIAGFSASPYFNFHRTAGSPASESQFVKKSLRQLDGMVVAITGASAGIGQALARYLHAHGARLALAARRTERLEQLATELNNQPLVVTCDVAKADDCRAFVRKTYEHFGRLDTLVCNAGIGLLRRIEDMSAEDWQSILAINVFGTTQCISAAVPRMRAQELRHGFRGQVMIVSSCLARRGLPDTGAYCVTKAAQLSIAEALRMELEADAIAVTSVHPITTSSDFFTEAEKRSSRPFRRKSYEPTQTPDEVAQAMAKAMVRPRAECWPHARSRWLFGSGALFPEIADGIVRKRMKD